MQKKELVMLTTANKLIETVKIIFNTLTMLMLIWA